MKRFKARKSYSKKVFNKGNAVKAKNHMSTNPMRGGYRL